MKKINKPRSNFRRVHSMQELKFEKIRLQMEEVIAKEKIKNNYRQIKDAFALRNIITTVTTELGGTSSLLSKVISIGKSTFGKRKKKKEKKKADEGIINEIKKNNTTDVGGQKSEVGGRRSEVGK
jgi:hypothetical protein